MENPIQYGWFGGYHYFRKHPYEEFTWKQTFAIIFIANDG